MIVSKKDKILRNKLKQEDERLYTKNQKTCESNLKRQIERYFFVYRLEDLILLNAYTTQSNPQI